jgi:hypothetical protein
MNFNKVREAIKAKNFQLDYFVKNATGMKPDGFRLALDNETLKVIELEKVSKALKLPMSYWWDDEANLISSENSTVYRNQKLLEDIEIKNEVIKSQLETIKDLRNRLGTFEEEPKAQRAV